MADLQELRDKVSSSVVDLQVENKRLEMLEKRLKDDYDIEVGDVEKAYKTSIKEKTEVEKEYLKKKDIIDKQLRKFGM